VACRHVTKSGGGGAHWVETKIDAGTGISSAAAAAAAAAATSADSRSADGTSVLDRLHIVPVILFHREKRDYTRRDLE